MLRGKWWEIFKEPELNILEEKLRIDNQNIKQFFETFMEARALIREARAQYYPTVNALPSYVRSGTSANLGHAASGAGGVVSTSGSTATLITLPLDVSWAPDLWGRVRNLVRQGQYAAQLSAADLENERLTEQANLAQFYFEIRGQDALQRVLDDTVLAYTKSLELAKARYEAQRAQRQYDRVEPENRLVVGTLKRRWNDALRHMAEVEEQRATLESRRLTLDAEQRQRLLHVGHDLDAVWQCPAAPIELKKRILHTVLHEIVIDATQEPL